MTFIWFDCFSSNTEALSSQCSMETDHSLLWKSYFPHKTQCKHMFLSPENIFVFAFQECPSLWCKHMAVNSHCLCCSPLQPSRSDGCFVLTGHMAHQAARFWSKPLQYLEKLFQSGELQCAAFLPVLHVALCMLCDAKEKRAQPFV